MAYFYYQIFVGMLLLPVWVLTFLLIFLQNLSEHYLALVQIQNQ